ncbi:hypothetical protein ACH5RR_035416 [Cinchona calisaya]|uniref:Uncharacterized protein n=1 Tax=Cinchona calisaya TaxID=153742 RepID=A0ABD2Y046_9GENT
MQANTHLRRNNSDDEQSNQRANALLRLEKLRMKRKAKIQDGFVSARRPRRGCKLPIPPTPPPRGIGVRKSNVEDVEAYPNTAEHLLAASKDNLFERISGGSSSCCLNPKFVSEYGGGLQGFPFDLLDHVDNTN